ncbi:DUF4255 domain-containing protein [Mucilaginibacter phyllosphaerae]|uniref:DUF4255 domain-containing protein n=1 Tax=Mucilaginibacter phyllosphaerae TaxID=1812349 RepID=A0A4Y8AD93_9SPHI|nr:DUF4255 domain-containing protein [Mucilaginibacter phyllosphaerae]MBB3969174.1 hypothetical protein [Mucilaginibacter phyllosphaerae]TEW66019.1 DUF4255 domain-containing protein [Mucilaginibacter phyllosphaerae]GGH06787.1 hypothetical protein GCM10007352_11170 [Mucilaginibacter phyllosphaerae]
MINEVLVMLKDKLNDYCKLKTGLAEDKVVFPDGSDLDPAHFPNNSIVPILVNFEEEKVIRAANRFEGVMRNGIKTDLSPSISLNLMVLFVARFTDYEQSMKFLSLIIRFFQRNRVFDQFNAPSLSPEVGKIKMELLALPLQQQNELWGSLRTAYQPSVLYKVSLLTFHDDGSIEIMADVSETQTNISVQ